MFCNLMVNKMSEINPVNLETGEVPPELTYTPVPFVALLGLNAANNETHLIIWNAFTVNRSIERVPLYFKLLNEKHNFRPAKPKKSSYEWHIPKGILKTNWMSKHLFEIPSVVVLFADLDWDDQLWNEKRTDCVAKIEYLRRSLSQRNTRLVLILIQKNVPLPGDDTLATEKAALLCSSCDLPPKSLFVLPVNDIQQLMGYILRMENAIFELSKMYYQHECKTVKLHRDYLNKTTHQFLFVRHQFKVAFLSEIKQDGSTALKHYKQAYANLMEVRVTLTNLFEIKTIGGFINYKICKLSFCMNSPLDAISQFRKHIDIFKNKCGSPELGFEHCSWLSKQYSIFGDLFDHAISSGLVPSQIQHPGYYYYESAVQAMNRKKLCRTLYYDIQIDDTALSELYSNMLTLKEAMEFFGQRWWRPAIQTLEPLDNEKEKSGIKVLQYKELNTVNHSAIIITLLSCAINQFKKYKCPRMKRYLMVLVGEEYYFSRDYSNALTFFNNVLSQYREERWQILVENILTTALRSAYLSADMINFIKLGLEFICEFNSKPIEEKRTVQMSIEKVLSHEPPLMLLGINETESENAIKLWNNLFPTLKEPIIMTMRMDSVLPFINCVTKFNSLSFHDDENITLDVYFTINCPNPLKFSKLNVLFSNQYYNQFCEINTLQDSSSTDDLLFEPMKTRVKSFNFMPQLQDIGHELSIIGVSLTLGQNCTSIVLQWIFQNKEEIHTSFKHRETISSITDADSFGNKNSFVAPLLKTYILPRKSRLMFNVHYNPTAFLNEYFLIRLNLKNSEGKRLENVELILNTIKQTENSVDETMTSFVGSLKIDSESALLNTPLKMNDIEESEEIIKDIMIEMNEIGFYLFTFTLNYEMKRNSELVKYTISKEVVIDFISPFFVSCDILNLTSNIAAQIRVDEPFFLSLSTKTLNPIPLEIIGLEIQFNDSFHYLEKFLKSETEKSDEIHALYKIVCTKECIDPCSFGWCCINWKRIDSNIHNFIKIPLPSATVEPSILFVELKVPEICAARCPSLLTYVIHNRADHELPIELSIGTCDNFMYAGNKLIQISILPHQFSEQHYIFYPLVCGSLLLPKLRIITYPNTPNASAIDYIDQIVQNNLMVVPQDKEDTKEEIKVI